MTEFDRDATNDNAESCTQLWERSPSRGRHKPYREYWLKFVLDSQIEIMRRTMAKFSRHGVTVERIEGQARARVYCREDAWTFQDQFGGHIEKSS